VCGDNERGVGGVTSRLVAEFAGDLDRDAGCVYGSDLLRIREPVDH